MPSAHVFLPAREVDGFSPLVGQEPVHPPGLRTPLVQPGQALPGPGGGGLDVVQPPAAGRRGGQDGHAGLAAARVAGPVPPSGAGDVLELGAEGNAAAEAGNPRDAGVV